MNTERQDLINRLERNIKGALDLIVFFEGRHGKKQYPETWQQEAEQSRQQLVNWKELYLELADPKQIYYDTCKSVDNKRREEDIDYLYRCSKGLI